MARAAPLAGMSVLVVEDNCMLADDVQYILQQAGAEVLGPCATGEEAIAELHGRKHACAVVDINLGEGPDFRLARALRRRRVPFIFLTGYDSGSIPFDLQNVDCVEKPASATKLLEAVAGLTRH